MTDSPQQNIQINPLTLYFPTTGKEKKQLIASRPAKISRYLSFHIKLNEWKRGGWGWCGDRGRVLFCSLYWLIDWLVVDWHISITAHPSLLFTCSFGPFLLLALALFAPGREDDWVAAWVLGFARQGDGEADVMTVGCTIHFSSGDVEIAVTVGTKEAAALVSVSWKNPHQTDMQ